MCSLDEVFREGEMNTQEIQKWREVLAKKIKDPQQKQQIALALNISQATLMRWVNGDSKPRRQNMRRLSQMMPEYRALFAAMEPEYFEEEGSGSEEPEAIEIPSIFYARVLNAHCNLPRVIHFSSLCDVILQQALKQLDPQRVGMEITVAQCMYPSKNGMVRSLREQIGQATPPWNRDMEPRVIFLGAESLAGFVVSSGHQLIEDRQRGMSRFSVQWVDWEESAMGYPIMRSDRIAGCLLVSSAQPEYFASYHRQKLVQCYAELLSVIFEPESFYPLACIDLGHMPAYNMQPASIVTFRQRIAKMMVAKHVNVAEAERLVWQEIEDEFLQKRETPVEKHTK